MRVSLFFILAFTGLAGCMLPRPPADTAPYTKNCIQKAPLPATSYLFVTTRLPDCRTLARTVTDIQSGWIDVRRLVDRCLALLRWRGLERRASTADRCTRQGADPLHPRLQQQQLWPRITVGPLPFRPSNPRRRPRHRPDLAVSRQRRSNISGTRLNMGLVDARSRAVCSTTSASCGLTSTHRRTQHGKPSRPRHAAALETAEQWFAAAGTAADHGGAGCGPGLVHQRMAGADLGIPVTLYGSISQDQPLSASWRSHGYACEPAI